MDIKEMVKNCESCVIKPCQIGCPLNNDITGFIKELNNLDDIDKLLEGQTTKAHSRSNR